MDPLGGVGFVKHPLSKNAEMVLGQQHGTVAGDGHTLRCSNQEAIVTFGGKGVCDVGTGDL
jgi:hypothetical protein